MKKQLESFNVVSLAALALAVIALTLGLARAEPDSPGAGAPTVVSFQGRVTVAGAAHDGLGFFKFALVDEAGVTSYWSNDGSSSAGGEPTNGTPLPVSNGLFTVLLGDPALTNMSQPLDANAFSGTERYLRVWFSADNITFEQLSPDRRVASVPFALQAENSVQAENADTVDGRHAEELELPPRTLVLGRTEHETTLLDAGFTYTGRSFGEGWTAKASLPTGRSHLAAAVVDGVVYALGGISSASNTETANEAYDPVTNAWTTKAPMPTGRSALVAAVADGVIYAIGGASAATLYETANEAYDPDTNVWTTKAPLPTGRDFLAAATVDGVVYALGGWSSATFYETANEAYDPATNAWTTKAPLPTGRRGLAAAPATGMVYALGGSSSATFYETANEAYDPVTNVWTTMAPLPTGRYSLAAATVDDVIYALGGLSSALTETANEAYDPVTNVWTARAPLPTGRFTLAAAMVDGVIYALGGTSGSPETANEAFQPALYLYER